MGCCRDQIAMEWLSACGLTDAEAQRHQSLGNHDDQIAGSMARTGGDSAQSLERITTAPSAFC